MFAWELGKNRRNLLFMLDHFGSTYLTSSKVSYYRNLFIQRKKIFSWFPTKLHTEIWTGSRNTVFMEVALLHRTPKRKFLLFFNPERILNSGKAERQVDFSINSSSAYNLTSILEWSISKRERQIFGHFVSSSTNL